LWRLGTLSPLRGAKVS